MVWIYEDSRMRMRIMLISHSCFSCFWAALRLNQGLVSISYCPAREETGILQQLGGGHSQGNCLPADQRDIPDLLPFCWTEPGRVGRGLAACSSGTGWTLVSSWWAIVHYMLCILFYHKKNDKIFCPVKPFISQPILILCSSTWGRQVSDCVVFSCLPG